MPHRNTYAAVDLGSNSFHLLVARLEHGELRVIDRIKEMVRLAAGVDAAGRLDPEIRQRALECLARFGQRLKGIPDDHIRAVGTQTFRRLNSPRSFMVVAETTLGCPIEVVSGREEARLVYLGVTRSLPPESGRRLIIDIGGGSTEIVVGQGETVLSAASFQYGCVGVTHRFFDDGRISARRWNKARATILEDLQEIRTAYRKTGWSRAIGSSGTNRAIHAICETAGWCEQAVTPAALETLRAKLIESGESSSLDLAGLSTRRRPVLVGGTVILDACFEALGIESMTVSQAALREGLVHDLMGRLAHHDPREASIAAMAERYGIDRAQAGRVRDIALAAFEQVADNWRLQPVHRDLLHWVCQVHEIGLAISHSHYQTHSAYLLENTDMAGFSRQEQQVLSLLAGHHRRKIGRNPLESLPERLRQPVARLLILLRLAVVLCRSRSDHEIPDFALSAGETKAFLALPEGWLDRHPLTDLGLRREQGQWKKLGYRLEFETLDVPAWT